MDETEADDIVTVGQRLKEAREAKGISVEYRPTIDEVEAATTTGGRSDELKEAA